MPGGTNTRELIVTADAVDAAVSVTITFSGVEWLGTPVFYIPNGNSNTLFSTTGGSSAFSNCGSAPGALGIATTTAVQDVACRVTNAGPTKLIVKIQTTDSHTDSPSSLNAGSAILFKFPVGSLEFAATSPWTVDGVYSTSNGPVTTGSIALTTAPDSGGGSNTNPTDGANTSDGANTDPVSLATTGSNVSPFLAGGLALSLAGGALLLKTRRRRLR